MTKHKKLPENYSGSSLRELAVDISNLDYESLTEFLDLLGRKLYEDSIKDKSRGRTILAAHLSIASSGIDMASDSIEAASKICKPYNDISTKEL